MGEIQRGQDVNLDVFREGVPVQTIQMQSITINLDSTEERQERCGTRLETPRQVLHGFSGQVVYEEETSVIEDLLDVLVARYQGGLRTVRLDLVVTSYYPESGETRTYVYQDCTFKLSRNVAGKNDPTQQTLDWMSATRVLV